MYTRNSPTEFVEMDFKVPVTQILKEYNNITNSLVIHRPADGHKDWYAVTLYGIDSKSTNSHWEYFKQKKNITDIGKQCPDTMSFIKSLPYSRIDDARFLVIKSGGYIAEHIDVKNQNWLEPLNISIQYPKGSNFILNDKIVPYSSGKSYVINIHYKHSVTNNSPQDRIHLVIHGKKEKNFYDYAKDKAIA